MSLKIVSGDEFIVTHSTGIWIVPSLIIHASLHAVPGDETLVTQRTLISISK